MKCVNVVASFGRMWEGWDEWWCSARRRLVTAIKWSFDLETVQRSLQFCNTDVRSPASYPPSPSFCPLLQFFGACSWSPQHWCPTCLQRHLHYSSNTALKLLHQNPAELNVGLHNWRDLILGLSAFSRKDQWQTSKAPEEKVVMPMCTNPKPMFNYFL